MDDITRGIRELIRSVFREKGIRHNSSHKAITSVCYADWPIESIEYQGPINVTYNIERNVVRACCYGGKQKVTARSGNLRFYCQVNQYDLRWIFSDGLWLSVAKLSPWSYLNSRWALSKTTCDVIDETIIEAADPQFCERLGAFLDKHVLDRHKEPCYHKKLFTSTKSYITDIGVSVVKPSLCRRIIRYLFGAPDIMFCYEQMVARYCQLSPEQLEFLRAVSEMLASSSLSRRAILADTEAILKTHGLSKLTKNI